MKLPYYISLILILLQSCGYVDESEKPITKKEKQIEYETIAARINKFRDDDNKLTSNLVSDSKHGTVIISKEPLGLRKKEIILDNPFGKFDYVSLPPRIYKEHIIAVFNVGQAACYSISNLERNHELENIINKKEIQNYWIIDSALVIKSSNEFYFLDKQNEWQIYDGFIPFDEAPIIFQDEKWLVFRKCMGEFWGLAFFYNKESGIVYNMDSQCASSVYKSDEGYVLLSTTFHMGTYAKLELVNNPDCLDEIQLKEDGFKYFIKSDYPKVIKENLGEGALAIFKWNSANLYFGTIKRDSFIFKVRNDTIEIVDSFLNANWMAPKEIPHFPVYAFRYYNSYNYSNNITIFNFRWGVHLDLISSDGTPIAEKTNIPNINNKKLYFISHLLKKNEIIEIRWERETKATREEINQVEHKTTSVFRY
jgi:hypothetical protein